MNDIDKFRAELQNAFTKASMIPSHMLFTKHPEIKGYILLSEYPGCNKKVGDFEPYTSGEFSKYPNIWKPVYHKEIEREKKINELLGE
jgi:hypothetical protein